MKKLFFVLVFGLILGTVFFTTAFAEKGGCDNRGMCKENADEKLLNKASFILENSEELGLSEDQIANIKTVKLNAKKSVIKNNADIEVADLEIKEALDKETIDLNNINALIDKKYNIKSQEAKTLINSCVEIKKILNNDQAKKVKELYHKSMTDGKCMMDGKAMMDNKKSCDVKEMNKG